MRGRPSLWEKEHRNILVTVTLFIALVFTKYHIERGIIPKMFYFLMEDFTKCVVFRIFLILVIE